MSLEITFKHLVDSTQPTLNDTVIQSLASIYHHYGIEYDNALQSITVDLYLQGIVKASLSSGSDYKVSDLRKLRDQFILRYVVDDDEQSLNQYLPIVDTILSIIDTSTIYSLNHGSPWKKAIQAVLDIHYFKKINYTFEYIARIFKRQVALGTSAKNLKKDGYELMIENGQVIINRSQQEKLINRLEADIKFIGGINVVFELFSLLEKLNLFDTVQQRYHLVRYFNSNEPNIPITYILNLAVKFPQKSNIFIPGSPQKTWERLLKTSQEFASIIDVQPYWEFELYFPTTDNLVNFLQEIVVYDNLFSLIQLRASDALKILLNLFSWIDKHKFVDKTGLDLNEIFKLIEVIIQNSNQHRQPIIYDKEWLSSNLPEIPQETLSKILDILAHDKSANKKFSFPTDISCVDFQFKPLIKLDNKQYILLNPSWCLPAFYESVLSYLRQNFDSKIDENNQFGHQVEEFVKNELASKGVVFKSGKYKMDGTEGECDVVIETENTIIFIEIKKKALTRKAKSGNDIDIFVDISKSLMDAQIQLGGHEILIKKFGYLELYTDSNKQMINLNGRNIARIAMTLLDFGGLQDRTIVSLLQKMLGKRIEVNDKKYQEKVNEIQKKINLLQEQQKQLDNLASNSQLPPFFNCWFISIPQLLILLDNVNSNESFKTELWKTRNISTNSLDFYYEYSVARDLTQ
ncbi:MAG TPA: hypothetical protein VK184_15840 [Nostocaceae cyanobacterium]|nr:hypothetical protein [Nostocaceae cyanobacterium]